MLRRKFFFIIAVAVSCDGYYAKNNPYANKFKNTATRKPSFLIPRGGSTVTKKSQEDTSQSFLLGGNENNSISSIDVASNSIQNVDDKTAPTTDNSEELSEYGHMFVIKRGGRMEKLDKDKVISHPAHTDVPIIIILSS
jgi:hypothetical protein